MPAATARQWHVPDLSQFSDQESWCGVGCFTHTPTSPSEPRVSQATPQTHNIQQRHFPYDKRDGVGGGQARVRKRAAVPPRAGVPTLARFVRSWPGMSLCRRYGDHAWDFSIEISGPTTGDADTPFGCPCLLPRSRFPCHVLLNTLITALCVRQLITGVDVDRVPFHRAPV